MPNNRTSKKRAFPNSKDKKKDELGIRGEGANKVKSTT
jgi:hypothetical protein